LSESPALPWSALPEGLRIAVRLTPRGGRDAVEGIAAGADGRPVLAVRVSAPPVEGAANAALLAVLAKALGVPRARIGFVSGETARLKVLRVEGDGPALAARLASLCESGAGRRPVRKRSP